MGEMVTSPYVHILEATFITGMALGSRSVSFDDPEKWFFIVVRYLVYIVTMQFNHKICVFISEEGRHMKTPNWRKTYVLYKHQLYLLAGSVAILLYNKQKLLEIDFILLYVAYWIIKNLNMTTAVKTSISYGTGMASSYMEGYLALILPSDGASVTGVDHNMRCFEAAQGVVFPVRRLFLVITKSLYCPPDLKHFNKPNRPDLPYLEACQPLEEVVKDVAGVKNRSYRNHAYKIYRPGPRPPVHLVAEFASPLHTLHRVLQKRTIYEKLVDADVDEIVQDFCSTLKSIIERDPECRNKCELVYYDDTDPTINLADVLLKRIEELVPNLEQVIRTI